MTYAPPANATPGNHIKSDPEPPRDLLRQVRDRPDPFPEPDRYQYDPKQIIGTEIRLKGVNILPLGFNSDIRNFQVGFP